MAVRKELKRYARNSSVKGIPRILQSDNTFLKILWISTVLIGLTVASYLVSQNLAEYLSYNSVVNIHERTIKPTFPDVSVCKVGQITYYILVLWVNAFYLHREDDLA